MTLLASTRPLQKPIPRIVLEPTINSGSLFLKDDQAGTQNTLFDLSLGEILIKAKKLHSEKSKFEVKTPTSIVGVRGTTFSVTVEAVK